MKKVLEFLKQKTTLTGIGSVLIGTAMVITGSQNEGIQTILGGLGLIFIRQAVNKK